MNRSAVVALASGLTLLWGQSDEIINADHAECAFFGKQRVKKVVSRETEAVVALLGGVRSTQAFVPGGSRTFSSLKGSNSGNVVDKHIFGVLQTKGIERARIEAP